ncbi:hypothetical protein E1A91_D09G204800v1 [Gossypium mustelinum]|uniref:UBA domain-containing protein n=1 Tax=Gossypium mustelinum TaxID=34275 RepID=A0A5D2TLR9_GOSMU|nr:hypothetical protein E1A91_D09G204800v1 [Gossypium mustelinum]
MYRQQLTSTSSSSSRPMYRPSIYPNVGQPGHAVVPPAPRTSSSPSSSAGLGIRVVLKPDYRITPLPQFSPQVGDIRRSNFQFDFEFERKILAQPDAEFMNLSQLDLENHPSEPTQSTPSSGANSDSVLNKYIASGLSQEAVIIAVANYGDSPTKAQNKRVILVREFVNGYNLLREMGFSANNVADALLVYDNDTDKALAHFLNSSS